MKAHKAPYIFDEFFASGKEESISPFLTPGSRPWGKNLPLKSAFISAGFLALAYAASFALAPLQILPLIFVYFLSGTPALIAAIEDLKKFEINIDILMTMAALLSIVIGSPLEGGLLLVLFEISAAMEMSVTHKTKGALLLLHELSPRAAYVIEDTDIIERSVKDILPGTKLLVKAGEIVPLDGKVLAGSSFVHLKHLTGESEPIAKSLHDEVPAGARNLDGTLTIEVLRSSSDSTLTRIIQLITQAQESKPRIERFLDKFGKWYALTIISLSFIFAFSLPILLQLPFLGPEGSIYRALAFLIAASPCALIIATPTAYLSAINSCAKRGILLKGGVVLDAITKCKTVTFDKTGTLTSGELRLSELKHLLGSEKISFSEALAIAASLEQNTTHPIGQAICKKAEQEQLPIPELRDFRSYAGLGLEGVVETASGKIPAAIGNIGFIEQRLPSHLQTQWLSLREPLRKEDKILSFLLIGEELFVISLSDEIRPLAKGCIDALKQRGNLRLVMLSGDRHSNAQRVANLVGIEEVAADLKPEDKLGKVAEFSQKDGLIMIGDGINDAPALARATVGIALGKVGSATAIEAADAVFMNDDLSSLDWLIKKSHQTIAIVRQNLHASFSRYPLCDHPSSSWTCSSLAGRRFARRGNSSRRPKQFAPFKEIRDYAYTFSAHRTVCDWNAPREPDPYPVL